MVKPHSSRTKQQQKQQQALAREREKARAFLGSAKIKLQHLSFTQAQDRAPDEKNDKFLLDTFRRNGCDQLDPVHRIAATVDEAVFRMALSHDNLTSDLLQGRDPADLPMLSLPDGFRVQCLRGAHRIRAARGVLAQDQQWWIVDLYAQSTLLGGRCGHMC